MASFTLKLARGRRLRCPQPPRIKSLLTTIFGDVASVHGGSVNLASLIRLAADFGASERNVRTAIHRLVKDRWLLGRRSGRTSSYSLAPEGAARFEAASERIYAHADELGNKRWTIILAPKLAAAKRETLLREMGWMGFARAGRNMLINIGDDHGRTETVLRELGLSDQVLVFHADCLMSDTHAHRNLLWSFADENWGLVELKRRYQAFLRIFAKLGAELARGGELGGPDALRVRVLLVHEYRRALLHDPDLPARLLPTHWNGSEARELASGIYRAVAPASEAEVRSFFATASGGALPPASARFWERFGAAAPTRRGRRPSLGDRPPKNHKIGRANG